MPVLERVLLTAAQWDGVAAPASGASARRTRKVADAARVAARGDLDGLGSFAAQAHAAHALDAAPSGGGARGVAREDAAALSVADFRARYERPNLPVVIDGAAAAWPALRTECWTPAELFRRFRHRRFRAGEDDDGKPVRIKLKYFLRYMRANEDDSPLYVFDTLYLNSSDVSRRSLDAAELVLSRAEAAAAAAAAALPMADPEPPAPAALEPARSVPILHDYSVPDYFGEDLLALVGKSRRPPFRWFLLGPKRSGTAVHIDPLGTSAWNTLVFGKKQWVLFPPDVPRDKVRAVGLKKAGEDDEAIDYFLRLLPRLKEREGAAFASRVVEFTQLPGETVFVPGGWWHAVLNVEDSVAMTQNFASSANFERVWLAARGGRRGMARKWLRVLRDSRPDLAAEADALNTRDGWVPEAGSLAHRERRAAQKAARDALAQRRVARALLRLEAKAAKAAARATAEAAGAMRISRVGGSGSTSESSESECMSSESSSTGHSSSSGSVTSISSLSSGDTGAARAVAGTPSLPAAARMHSAALAGPSSAPPSASDASSSEEEGAAFAAAAARRRRRHAKIARLHERGSQSTAGVGAGGLGAE